MTHIEWRMAPEPGKKAVFLTTSMHFSVLDVDTLAPNWGEMTEGIHAGLSVDRPSFGPGEQIPLHIRWENVNPSTPLGQGSWGASTSVGVRISTQAITNDFHGAYVL